MQQPFDVTPSAPQNAAAQGPITVSNVSHQDLGAAMPGVTATGGIMVKFFYVRVQIKSKNAAENGKWETRLCIAKQPRADRSTVATNFISVEDAKRLFPNDYHHFTQNEDVPTNGTPLNELPGITMSQVGLLTLNGLRSIEDVADITDEQAREIGFEAIRAHKLAKMWRQRLEDSAEDIDVAQLKANHEQERDETTRQMQAMAEQLKQAQMQIAALQSVQGKADVPSPNEPIMRAVDDGLPDIDDMPNPMAEGSAVAELSDPLAE